MFRSLFARLFSPRPAQPIRRSPRRLGLEVLEGREVPAVITVNGLTDTIVASSILNLREAISLTTGALTFSQLSAAEKAQVSGPIGSNDRIQFSVAGTLNLTSALPTFIDEVKVEGPGAGKVTINGTNLHRIFNVGVNGDVTVSGLRLFQGFHADSGGAILNNGNLSLYQVEIDHSSAGDHGGAIENNGTLLVDESFLHDNTAAKVGGAIDNNGSATITNTTLMNNIAGNNGGAIWSDGLLILKNDTITGNKAVNAGGGLRVTGGTVTVTSSTITSNKADTDGSTFEHGGGISNDGATLTLNNTVVTGNTRNQVALRDDVNGAASGQFNFIGVNTGLTGINNGIVGNKVGTAASPLAPKLEALANTGGFAPTFTPAPDSPLLAAGAATSIAGITDQRGAGRRPSGATIGAVEVNNPLSPVGVSRHLDGPGPIATANEAFVKALYRVCLLRDADAGGLANWLNILNGDPTKRAEVVNGFYNSTENRNNQVTFFYRYFLDREPDAGGLAHWVGQLQSGVDEANVMRGFLLSPEFTGQNNNTEFVKTLYYALLGRNADAGGFAFWKGQLDNGTMSRAEEVDAFARSLETVQRVVNSYHQVYLGVEPSAGLLQVQSAAIQSGFTFGLVARSILGSDAFFNKAAANVGP